MAPKRKLERKTGIHTLRDTPPSKKTKTTQATPKATGLHTLAGSNTKSKDQPSKATPKKGLHTLANVSVGRNSANLSRDGRSHTADDENDGDYVEDEATLDSDEDDLTLGSSANAYDIKESNGIHEAREYIGNTEALRLGTRSQSRAAIRHEGAARAKLMFLERLSKGTGNAGEKDAEANDSGIDGLDKERDAEV